MKQVKESDLVNLMDSAFSDIPQPKAKKEQQNDDDDEDQYYPHWKKEINVNLICDNSLYNKSGSMPSEIARNLKVDFATMTYAPIIYMSDFWHLKKDFRPMNDSLDGISLNLTLNFQNMDPYYFNFQQNFARNHAAQQEWGLETLDLDELKRIYVETDKLLLTVTMIVSALHSIFEFLAFKNDISFWNNKESMEGISIKSLYF